MIIQSHNIQLDSSRTLLTHREVSEQLDLQKGDKRIHLERNQLQSRVELQEESNRGVGLTTEQVDFSPRSIQQQLAEATRSQPQTMAATAPKAPKADDESSLPPTLQMMKRLLEKLTGRKIKIFKPVDMSQNPAPTPQLTAPVANGQNNPAPANTNSNGQWGMEYTFREVQYRKESVAFAAAGTVTTADGREINFAAQLEMSNETYKEFTLQIKAGQPLTDPLALNLDGKGVALTDEKFAFDLNMDGETENISFLKAGSGFLVLDKNQNQQVDDGSELFGPATNNGFMELKAYDGDNNDWIDENDTIYYQLNLWTKDETGADVLSSLQANNVGAIYLNSAQTQMEMTGGQLKETGVYLTESGNVNFVQEVDLAT